MLPDTEGVPSPLPADWDALDRRRGSNEFRRHVAIDWRRCGYIGYDAHVARSLRVGPRFRERSRALNSRAHDSLESNSGESVSPSAGLEDSLSAEATRSLLRITATSLRRLSRRGHLHVVECGTEWRYPTWQFAGRPRFAVLPGVDVAASAKPKNWPPSAINSFMMAPQRELAAESGIHSPVDWLIRGNDPHQVANILKGTEVRR